MTAKRKSGRTATSRDVRIIPEFREKPDIEKLGRALIAIAESLAKKKKSEGQLSKKVGGEGDAVP